MPPSDPPPAPVVDVGIFWDLENVRIPKEVTASTVSSRLRHAILPFGKILEQNLYYDSRKFTERATDRVSLDLTGWHLVDCPTRNSKETLDKKLIVDVMQFAWHHTYQQIPCCVVLITSDGDYSYALSRIRNLGHKTVVIYGEATTTARVLLDVCEVAISFFHDVLSNDNESTEEEDEKSTASSSTSVATSSAATSFAASPPPSGGPEQQRNTTTTASLTTKKRAAAAEATTTTTTATRSPAEQQQQQAPARNGVDPSFPRRESSAPSESARESSCPPPPPLPRPVDRAALARSIGEAVAGRHLVLLHSIHEARTAPGETRWKLDSLAAVNYHAKKGRVQQAAYGADRHSAIVGGFVEFGRKDTATGIIRVLPPGDDGPRGGALSCQCYLRLTQHGLAQLEENTETAAANVLRAHNSNGLDQQQRGPGKSQPPSATSFAASRAAKANPPNRKTILCKYFANNRPCPNGDKCGFAHGEAERRALRKPPLIVPCRYWNGHSGSCRNGVECPFAHQFASSSASK